MSKTQNSKRYDLEDRTFKFALKVKSFIKQIPKTVSNIEYTKQLIRSSGSVGANYIEANESHSKKDFLFRVRLCRKEVKESRYWLKLIESDNGEGAKGEQPYLIQEATELMMIFGSIINKVQNV